MVVLFVQKIICLMSKKSFYGFVYFVTVCDKEYIVKVNHLDEFVSLMYNNGAIVITGFEKSKVVFDNVYQWYKAL